MINRFDYVDYDEKAQTSQSFFKQGFSNIGSAIEAHLPKGRATNLALTALEEAYMWIGKAIRDDQVDRNEETNLKEERSNS